MDPLTNLLEYGQSTKTTKVLPTAAIILGLVLASLILATVAITTLGFSSQIPLLFSLRESEIPSTDSAATAESATLTQCDYAILGGGIAGVFTAYQLAKAGKQNICVVEATSRLGGRLETFTLGNSKKYDLGGVRVNNQHTVMKNLAAELNINFTSGYYVDKYEAQALGIPSNVLMVSRGVRTDDKEILRAQGYPLASGAVSGWDVLLDTGSAAFQNSPLQDTFSYTQSGLGSAEEMSYFMSTFRFRGDFQAVDRKTYAEFALADSVDPLNFYPIGGMGEFVRKMSLAAQQTGRVTFFMSESVKSIDLSPFSTSSVKKYLIGTSLRFIHAKNVIINIPPQAFKQVTGQFGSALNASPALKQSKAVPVVTILLRFASRWWEQVSPARRIWTDSNCLQYLEIPLSPQGKETNAFRAAYADGHCAKEWNDLYEMGGSALVQTTVMNYLKELYPNTTIPTPVELVYRLWNDAWYFEKPSATLSIDQKQQWALNPITGEKIVFVGEAFHLERTWSVGAVKSAIAALNTKLGVSTNY